MLLYISSPALYMLFTISSIVLESAHSCKIFKCVVVAKTVPFRVNVDRLLGFKCVKYLCNEFIIKVQ